MATCLFVTGASGGIGAAFPESVPTDIHAPRTFSRRPAGGNWTEVDLGHPGQWPAARDAAEAVLDAEHPEPAIFLHCSGTGDPIGNVVDLDPQEDATVVTLNAAAVPSLGQAFLRSCHRRGIRATLVLTSSPAADKNVPGMAQYRAAKDGMQHRGTIVAMEQPPLSGNRVVTVVPYAVLTDETRSVMTRDPDEVPFVNYFRQIEAAGEFATPQTCTEHIWAAIDGAASGDIVPVGAVAIAQRAAAASAVTSMSDRDRYTCLLEHLARYFEAVDSYDLDSVMKILERTAVTSAGVTTYRPVGAARVPRDATAAAAARRLTKHQVTNVIVENPDDDGVTVARAYYFRRQPGKDSPHVAASGRLEQAVVRNGSRWHVLRHSNISDF